MTRQTNIQRIASVALVGLMTVIVGRSAVGQSDYSYGDSRPFHQPVVPVPVEYGFAQHHSSTALEGALRGKAAVIQALGNYELSQSQAAILRQQARALDRENDVKQTIALHAQQAMWQKAREMKREQREARVAEGRVKLAARSRSVYRTTYALSAESLNVETGEIRWPSAVEAARYAATRERLEELFRILATYGDQQPQLSVEIDRQVERLSRTLRRDKQTMPRSEYVAVQKFLRGLKYAGRELVG